MALNMAARRVAFFTAKEVHVRATGNEWIRQEKTSTKSLAAMINEFLAADNLIVVSVTDATIKELKNEPNRRVFQLSAAIIYQPNEVIIDETQAEAITANIKEIGQGLLAQAQSLSGKVRGPRPAARPHPTPGPVPPDQRAGVTPRVPEFHKLPVAD